MNLKWPLKPYTYFLFIPCHTTVGSTKTKMVNTLGSIIPICVQFCVKQTYEYSLIAIVSEVYR